MSTTNATLAWLWSILGVCTGVTIGATAWQPNSGQPATQGPNPQQTVHTRRSLNRLTAMKAQARLFDHPQQGERVRSLPTSLHLTQQVRTGAAIPIISHIGDTVLGATKQRPAKPVVTHLHPSTSRTAGHVKSNAVTTSSTLHTHATAKQTVMHSTSAAPTGSTKIESKNLYWLSRVIEAEAGGEPMEAKVAVGDVIINRVHSADYPNTVAGVIFQRAYGVYEFTSVENGWIYHTPTTSSMRAAKDVLYSNDNILPSALVFYVSAKTPAKSWVRTQPILKQIGDITFAK